MREGGEMMTPEQIARSQQEEIFKALAMKCADRIFRRMGRLTDPIARAREHDASIADFYLRARNSGWAGGSDEWRTYVVQLVKAEVKAQARKGKLTMNARMEAEQITAAPVATARPEREASYKLGAIGRFIKRVWKGGGQRG